MWPRYHIDSLNFLATSGFETYVYTTTEQELISRPGGRVGEDADHRATMASPKKGFYRQELTKTIWEVKERYRDLQAVGSGAYGSVCSAIDQKSGTKVAIKKLYRPFQSELFAKRAYRELRLLKHMKHENVSMDPKYYSDTVRRWLSFLML
ncbi:UNVERIFIED_CONTAM: hypothetical protein K2H54_060183 [Gekko kuhli]